jgi:hypothetical protein
MIDTNRYQLMIEIRRLRGGPLVNSRISAACAALVLIFTTALATPAPKTTLSSLTTLAHAIDSAAQKGDWTSAQRFSKDLSREWAVQRPTTLHGVKGKANAESFDASLKWINSAIAQRSARNVHDAAMNVEKSVHEMEERLPNV